MRTDIFQSEFRSRSGINRSKNLAEDSLSDPGLLKFHLAFRCPSRKLSSDNIRRQVPLAFDIVTPPEPLVEEI
jgi:hypothetical protein